MPEQLTRRKALGALGAVSVGALLAACGASDDPVTSTEVATSDGATATVQRQNGAAATMDELFADSATAHSPRKKRRARTTSTSMPCAATSVRIATAQTCGSRIYSGFESASTGGPGASEPTDDGTFLRGVQVTNSGGVVEFLTIYPGWYRGRTVQIHAKVHVDSTAALTTQMYFDAAVTDVVYANDPYAEHAERDTFNDSDGIFDAGLVMTLMEDGNGYVGVMTFGVDSA